MRRNGALPGPGSSALPGLGSVLPGAAGPSVAQSPADISEQTAPASIEFAGPAVNAQEPGAVPSAAVKAVEARNILAGPAAAETQPAAETADSWRGFWNAGPDAQPGPEAVVAGSDVGGAPSGLGKPGKAARVSQRRIPKSGLWGAAAVAAVPTLSWWQSAWTHVQPFAIALGALAGTYAVSRAVGWGVEKLAAKLGWRPTTRVAVKMGVTIALLTSGAGLGMHLAGATTSAVLTTFGVGGIAVTMAAKDFIGNFLEGVKVLLSHPFVVGDTIWIGDKPYKVRDMTLRYLVLDHGRKSTLMITYDQLAAKAVTILREYVPKRKIHLPSPRLRAFWEAATSIARTDLKSASWWTAVGAALLVGLPAAAGVLAWPALTTLLPYLTAMSWLVAGVAAQKWTGALVTRLGEKLGWHPQTTVVIKLAAQALSLMIGGGVALRAMGVTWMGLLASLGATSIAFGWASADIIGNLIQAFWLITTQPFKIGDILEVGGVQGQVVDMNMQYIALAQDIIVDGQLRRAHTLVPYSVIKSAPFSVLAPEDVKPPEVKSLRAMGTK